MTDLAPCIDLNAWHRALHLVTGAMALRWCRVTPAELQHWAAQLRSVAAQMDAVSASGADAGSAIKSAIDPFGAPPPWLTS